MTNEQINVIAELTQLTQWFNSYYIVHEQKYNRLIALNKLDDDGENPQTLLTTLYEEAEVKRKRIQELEKTLSQIVDNETSNIVQ